MSIPLLFSGKLKLHVILIHPSEAIDLLRRITSTKQSPGLHFHGRFQEGMLEEKKECNVWLSSPLNSTFQQRDEKFCNYGPTHLKQSWVCEKPKFLDCSKLNDYIVSRTNDASTILKRSLLFEP